jgi:hypothetical protein
VALIVGWDGLTPEFKRFPLGRSCSQEATLPAVDSVTQFSEVVNSPLNVVGQPHVAASNVIRT